MSFCGLFAAPEAERIFLAFFTNSHFPERKRYRISDLMLLRCWPHSQNHTTDGVLIKSALDLSSQTEADALEQTFGDGYFCDGRVTQWIGEHDIGGRTLC